jgi:hypothetical protein
VGRIKLDSVGKAASTLWFTVSSWQNGVPSPNGKIKALMEGRNYPKDDKNAVAAASEVFPFTSF